MFVPELVKSPLLSLPIDTFVLALEVSLLVSIAACASSTQHFT